MRRDPRLDEPAILTRIALVSVAFLVACGDATGPDEGLPYCLTHPATAVVDFEDVRLDLAVRGELSVSPQLDLTCEMVGEITSLRAGSSGITSLAGIENLVALTTLWIRDNGITDVGPLASLTGLTSLNLAANALSDVTPLAGLTELTFLAINDNGGIVDIGPLRGLTKLTGSLWIGRNAIVDLRPIEGLTGVTELNAWGNRIASLDGIEGLTGLVAVRVYSNALTDVDALRDLPRLTTLRLQDNADLADLSPLVANAALGGGASVNVTGTSARCEEVTTLLERGVSVISDCP